MGVDIGGSGIKGAPVDLEQGAFARPRLRIPTPKLSTPQACAEVIGEIIESFELGPDDPVGITVPAPVVHGETTFMANLHKSWAGLSANDFFSNWLNRPVVLVNDADAAGIAEMRYGIGRDRSGLVVMTTLGTGIGTALFYNGVLIPNTELGHIEINGHDAESRASSAYRERKELSFKQWANKSLQRYYSTLEMLLAPDLFIVGGGVSRHHEKFLPLLKLKTPIVPATLRNEAGIIGAALAAQNTVAG